MTEVIDYSPRLIFDEMPVGDLSLIMILAPYGF